MNIRKKMKVIEKLIELRLNGSFVELEKISNRVYEITITYPNGESEFWDVSDIYEDEY